MLRNLQACSCIAGGGQFYNTHPTWKVFRYRPTAYCLSLLQHEDKQGNASQSGAGSIGWFHMAAGIRCSETHYQGVHECVLGYDRQDGTLVSVCTPTEGNRRKLTSTVSSLESEIGKVNGKIGEKKQSLMTCCN